MIYNTTFNDCVGMLVAVQPSLCEPTLVCLLPVVPEKCFNVQLKSGKKPTCLFDFLLETLI
jgi:hypothetical protein